MNETRVAIYTRVSTLVEACRRRIWYLRRKVQFTKCTIPETYALKPLMKRPIPVTSCTECGNAGYNPTLVNLRCRKTINGYVARVRIQARPRCLLSRLHRQACPPTRRVRTTGTFKFSAFVTVCSRPTAQSSAPPVSDRPPFGEVNLQDFPNPLWLPREAVAYIEIGGQKFRNLHQFRDYRRYRVAVKIGTP